MSKIVHIGARYTPTNVFKRDTDLSYEELNCPVIDADERRVQAWLLDKSSPTPAETRDLAAIWRFSGAAALCLVAAMFITNVI